MDIFRFLLEEALDDHNKLLTRDVSIPMAGKRHEVRAGMLKTINAGIRAAKEAGRLAELLPTLLRAPETIKEITDGKETTDHR